MKMKLKQRNIKISIASAMLVGTVGLSSASFATTFDVTATVLGACTITATNMDFGDYDTTASTPTEKTSTITHSCTSGQTGTVLISQGSQENTGGSTDAAPIRAMTYGAGILPYTLRLGSSGGAIWGNTSVTGQSFTSTGSVTPVLVYGSIAAGETVLAGNYSDTVTVSIVY
ncbi:spore coat U domain-containing protein [Amylibacter sp.]|nr:spore coat U domain-containing protein [Amylibacter sp.]